MGVFPSGPSLRRNARLAALFQLLEATAVFGQNSVLGAFVVTGDPATTARRILANTPAFQLGFACAVVAVGFHLARALFINELCRPAGRSIASYAVSVIVVGCALQAVASLFLLAPCLVLGGADPAFSTTQSQELAYLFIRLHKQTFNTYLVFFGLWCLLTGVLLYRSHLMPRFVGVLLAITGLGWMAYLVPLIARRMFPAMVTASLLGETALFLGLLVIGVNARQRRPPPGAR